jgi:D-xylose transport system permease protein
MEPEHDRFSLKDYSGNLRAYAMILALILIWGLFSFATEGGFMTARNLSNLARQSCITGILAIGMVLVIVSANIDLSVVSMVGLTGGIAAILSVWGEMNIIPALGITLLTGLVIGLLQGWLVAYLHIPSFIVTLAGLLIFRGIIKGGTGGETVGPVSDTFKILGQGYLGIEVSWIIAAIVIGGMFIAVWRRYAKRKQQHVPGGVDGTREGCAVHRCDRSVRLNDDTVWGNSRSGHDPFDARNGVSLPRNQHDIRTESVRHRGQR